MLKFIPVLFPMIAVGAVTALDYMGFRNRSVEFAHLQDAATQIDADFEYSEVSYADHLLSMVGLAKGLPEASIESARIERQVLRAAPLNSYFPTPSEDVLAGWERIAWQDDFHTGFGWPDGMAEGKLSNYAPKLDQDIAIYLNGRSSIYLRAEFSEPTHTLATRLKQAYWVVETGRSLDRLHEGRPRASYFWTNVQETSNGDSVYAAMDHKHFYKVQGVHWLTAKSKTARRDETMRYMFASLGGGVVLKLRAHAPEEVIKQVLDQIDYQSLNQLQTLPSPLIAGGLKEHLLNTPEAWLAVHGDATSTPAHGTGLIKPTESQKAGTVSNHKEEMTWSKIQIGGFDGQNCSSEKGKTCKVVAH